MADQRKAALDVAIRKIEKNFGKGSIMRMGDATDMKVASVSSGSLAIDKALGIGGYPRGRIVEIYGPESSGKTTVALHAVAEVQRQGGTAAYIDAENALDPQYAEAYSNLGLVLLMKAQDFADQSTTDVNDPKYAQAQATIKKFYEEAKPYYEKARELKPDQKDLWAPGLYRVYYNLNMGTEFDEIEKLMNN